jgi:hypothetical protein
MVTAAVTPTNKLVLTDSFETVTDLAGKQFYFVKISADRRVALSDGGANYSIGVLMDEATGTTAIPKDVQVLVAGRVKVVAGADITAGNQIKVDTSGRAVSATPGGTTDFIVGVCTEATGTINAGELVECYINCLNATRTAT